MHGNKQQNIDIKLTKIKERIRKISNWKAPGPDGVHDYWIKMLVSLQERIALHQSCKVVLLVGSTRLDDNWLDCLTIEGQEQRKRSEHV